MNSRARKLANLLNESSGVLAAKTEVTALEISDSTLVTSAEGIAANNNNTTIPTSAAVKAYADAAVAGVSVNYGAGNAALSAGGVGTYVFAVPNTPSADINIGATIAGASLRTAGVGGAKGAALSGTWRCMGFSDFIAGRGGDPSAQFATLWLRIS